MLIAEVKEKENIAEYILYMWQMEDLVRGNDFELERIIDKLFPGQKDSEEKEEYTHWFSKMISEMKAQNIEQKGHLKSVQTYMQSLNGLHKSLLTVYQDKNYLEIYKSSAEHIEDLRRKTNTSDVPETEVCLVGLYGYLLLKLSGKEISDETKNAMKSIGRMVAYLADAFNKLKKGELQLPSSLNN